MVITKEITKLEHSNVKLTLTVGKDDIRSEYDKLLSEYIRTVQLPGFRKGKTPKDVLVRKFGDVLKKEVLSRIVEKSVTEVFDDQSFPKENRPLPYSVPAVQDGPPLEPDKDFQFSMVYDVLPRVQVGQWQGLEVEIPDVSITDEDLDRELEALRERNAVVLDKNDEEEAAPGDVVTVNYCELNDQGEALGGTERQDFVFTLGSLYNPFKFDDQVRGMKKGETKDFEKTYPADLADKDLAGKTKKLRVTLTALKLKQLPELDDELAQDVDEKFDTLEDLKKDIRERLSKDLDSRLKVIKINKLMEKVMENTPAVIPESMLRLELDSRWRNLARRFNTDSEGLYKIMGKNGKGAQSVIDGWKPDANRALHSRVIVETLIEELKLEASDQELDREIESQAALGSAGEVEKYYEQEEAREYLREDIKERKFFDRLLSENTIKPGNKEKYLDLISNNE
ncbi:MAG: trigger factor [Treponema sp.]|nr:trigger factor [Treponema sp.]